MKMGATVAPKDLNSSYVQSCNKRQVRHTVYIVERHLAELELTPLDSADRASVSIM